MKPDPAFPVGIPRCSAHPHPFIFRRGADPRVDGADAATVPAFFQHGHEGVAAGVFVIGDVAAVAGLVVEAGGFGVVDRWEGRCRVGY